MQPADQTWALQRAKNVLQAGGYLASCLQHRLDLSRGIFEKTLAHVTSDQIKQGSDPGKVLLEPLMTLLSDFLNEPNRVVVLTDPIPDQLLSPAVTAKLLPVRIIQLGEGQLETYVVVQSPGPSEEVLQRAVRFKDAPHGALGVLASLPDTSSLEDTTAPESFLDQICENTAGFFYLHGGYDGYVIWLGEAVSLS